MHKLNKAIEKIKKMNESAYFDLKAVFVSVDPDRDNVDKIKSYLKLFPGNNFIGITGSSNDSVEMRDIMKKFKIYASKIEYEEEDESDKNKVKNAYTIDHTIITYLMDDNNNYINFLGSNLSEHDLASTIVENILQNQKDKIKNY